jgi:hypothetical protein
MYTDSRISAAIEAMLDEITVPPVPLTEIQRKIAHSKPAKVRMSGYLRFAIASGIVACLLAILSSSGLIRAVALNVEDRYRAALEARGGFAPPAPPEALWQEVLKQASSSPNVTFAEAQSLVPFAITPPAGLPRDVVSARIRTTPTLVYSPVTHSWRVGSRIVWFIYRRSGGSTFQLVADQFDPNIAPPGKYIFEAKDPTPDGRPVIVRHLRLVWRNGDQVTSATADMGISAPEIEAIRSAMHGVLVPGRWPSPPLPGAPMKMFPAPEPRSN